MPDVWVALSVFPPDYSLDFIAKVAELFLGVNIMAIVSVIIRLPVPAPQKNHTKSFSSTILIKRLEK